MYHEGSFNRTVIVNFWFDLFNSGRMSHRVWSTFIFLPWFIINTFRSTSRSIPLTCLIREAIFSDYTAAFKIFPCFVHVSTIAAEVWSVARNHIFGRKNDVDLTAWGNSESIRKGFGGTKGPTGSTLLLISDFMNVFGPLWSWIKLSWSLGYFRPWVIFVWGNHIGTKHWLELFNRVIFQWVCFNIMRLPRWCVFSNFINHFLVDWVTCISNSSNCTNNDKLEHR